MAAAHPDLVAAAVSELKSALRLVPTPKITGARVSDLLIFHSQTDGGNDDVPRCRVVCEAGEPPAAEDGVFAGDFLERSLCSFPQVILMHTAFAGGLQLRTMVGPLQTNWAGEARGRCDDQTFTLSAAEAGFGSAPADTPTTYHRAVFRGAACALPPLGINRAEVGWTTSVSVTLDGGRTETLSASQLAALLAARKNEIDAARVTQTMQAMLTCLERGWSGGLNRLNEDSAFHFGAGLCAGRETETPLTRSLAAARLAVVALVAEQYKQVSPPGVVMPTFVLLRTRMGEALESMRRSAEAAKIYEGNAEMAAATPESRALLPGKMLFQQLLWAGIAHGNASRSLPLGSPEAREQAAAAEGAFAKAVEALRVYGLENPADRSVEGSRLLALHEWAVCQGRNIGTAATAIFDATCPPSDRRLMGLCNVTGGDREEMAITESVSTGTFSAVLRRFAEAGVEAFPRGYQPSGGESPGRARTWAAVSRVIAQMEATKPTMEASSAAVDRALKQPLAGGGCAACGAALAEGLKRCGRCLAVGYCNKVSGPRARRPPRGGAQRRC